MAEKQHLFANDGTDWTSEPSPVDPKEAREADRAVESASEEGEGPAASNEVRLSHTIVER